MCIVSQVSQHIIIYTDSVDCRERLTNSECPGSLYSELALPNIQTTGEVPRLTEYPALCQRIGWKVQRIGQIRWKGSARTLINGFSERV